MPIDTVNDLPPRVQYTAAASQTVFPYPFPIFEDGDLVVDVDGTTKALDTDYTVSGEGEDAGGNVTFLVARTAGQVVTIYRDLAIERTSDFQTNGPLSSDTFNNELDRITLVQQQLNDGLRRSLRLPVITTGDAADTELTAANWAGMYMSFDSSGIPTPAALSAATMTQATIGTLLNPRTTAEIAAGVTPTDYSKPSGPLIDGARLGFVGDNATINNTAMASAIAICTQHNGGVLVLGPGSYVFSAGFELPESMQIWGSGMFSTLLKANGNFTLVTLGSADSSRNALRNLGLQGTSKTGTGIRIGDTAHSGYHTFDKVYIASFFTGVRLSAALWSSFYNCLITGNENGVDYNAGSGSLYSNAIEFHGCTIISNDRSGIAATSTPVRNIGLKYIGGSIEQNGTEAPATYPQIVLGATAHFYFNTYIESTAATKPDAFNVSNASNGEIANCYINGSANGVKSSSAGCSHIFIHNCRFVSTTTKCIDLPSCLLILALHNEYDVSNTIDGSTSVDVTARIAQAARSSFTGTTTDITGTPTGSVEYTLIDDVVTLHIPQITGASPNTTAPTITGMPANIRPSATRSVVTTNYNNSAAVVSRSVIGTDGVITLYNGVSTTFTGSNDKGILTSEVSYKL